LGFNNLIVIYFSLKINLHESLPRTLVPILNVLLKTKAERISKKLTLQARKFKSESTKYYRFFSRP